MGEYREKLSELKKEQKAKSSERTAPVIAVILLLLAVCVIGLFVGIAEGRGGVTFGALGVGVLIIIVGVKALTSAVYPTEEEQAELNEYAYLAKRESRAERERFGVPEDAPTVTRKYHGGGHYGSCKYLMFVRDNKLCFHAAELNDFPGYFEIDIDEIRMFRRDGELYRETKITGGGGGGSSVAGALIGGVIAGQTGALIGSRKGTQEIKSEIVTHDSRKVLLTAKEEEYEFCHNDFDAFMRLIPQKEQSNVYAQSVSAEQERQENSGSVSGQIKELASLRDEGIITEEEFQTKKTELLSII